MAEDFTGAVPTCVAIDQNDPPTTACVLGCTAGQDQQCPCGTECVFLDVTFSICGVVNNP